MTDAHVAVERASEPSEQLVFEPGELLESHPVAEPLFAGGVRCHGGFDADGHYVSPRTRKRAPAIAAWQRAHVRGFGVPLLEVPLDSWPAHYPNVAQSKLLIQSGVTSPMTVSLTRIGTVEGYGGNIGRMALPDLQRYFAEDLTGTAASHLTRGLYEAHGRDEAGFGDEGGHRQMWFAARDVAFPGAAERDGPLPPPPGFGPGAQGLTPERAWPDDVEVMLEFQLARMVRLLFIELAAFRTFTWAEEVLADRELVAGEGAAGRLVSYIRADERPHVEYLRTVLSELRERTFVGASGQKYPGRELIGRTWERALRTSLGQSRRESRALALAGIESALDGRPDRSRLLEEFHALGDVRPGADGEWVETRGD